MKLTIIGTGYVGLVTGTCFAEVGHHVICEDSDANKVEMLKRGGIPIYEPGLEEMVKKHVANGRLRFTASTKDGVENSDIIFIAVPTPPQPDGSVDLSYIEGVARDVITASRPPILDRNGLEMAVDIRVPSLFAEPRRIIDVEGHQTLPGTAGLVLTDRLADKLGLRLDAARLRCCQGRFQRFAHARVRIGGDHEEPTMARSGEQSELCRPGA